MIPKPFIKQNLHKNPLFVRMCMEINIHDDFSSIHYSLFTLDHLTILRQHILSAECLGLAYRTLYLGLSQTCLLCSDHF